MKKEWGDTDGRGSRSIYIEFAVILAILLASVCIAAFAFVSEAEAHPGGLAADGCHNDRKNGGRHCHGASKSQQPTKLQRGGEVYYPNCAAARAAGVTPIYRGQPGYGTHLDRDGDGKACE